MDLINWAIARLKEPSTVVGLGLMAAALHWKIDNATLTNYTDSAAAILGILGMLMREGSPPATVPTEQPKP